MKRIILIVSVIGVVSFVCYFCCIFSWSSSSGAVVKFHPWPFLSSERTRYGEISSPKTVIRSDRNLERAIDDYNLTDLFKKDEKEVKNMFLNQLEINHTHLKDEFSIFVKGDTEEQAHQMCYALIHALREQCEVDKKDLKKRVCKNFEKHIKKLDSELQRLEGLNDPTKEHEIYTLSSMIDR